MMTELSPSVHVGDVTNLVRLGDREALGLPL